MSIIKRILGMENGKGTTVNTTTREPHNFSHEEGQFQEKRIRGKVTRVDPKGFGFIISRDIPFTRIFFHWSGLLQSTVNFAQLEKGMMVEFNPLLVPDKGYRALRIEVVNKVDTDNDADYTDIDDDE
jgi:cold shock CspA family protein